MPDDSMPGTLGVISGIMNGIAVEARTALQQQYDPGNPAVPYREALQRILAQAERAESMWYEHINRELPEHKEDNR